MKTLLTVISVVLLTACGSAEVLTVATFNSAQGAGERYQSPSNRRAQAAFFNSHPADVIAMQEVDKDSNRSGGVFLTAIETVGLKNPKHVPGDDAAVTTWAGDQGTVVFGKALEFTEAEGGGEYGLATYIDSRFPILSVTRVAYNGPTDEQRIALIVRTAEFTIINTHLSVYGADPVSYRKSQLAQLAAIVAAEPGHVIITGDFNCTVGDVLEGMGTGGGVLVRARLLEDSIDQILANELFNKPIVVETDTTDHKKAIYAQLVLF